ncbi:MAG: hypothetical protein ABIT16_08930 [Croceibacterium sp.]
MSRADIAYLLVAAFLAVVISVSLLSSRYMRFKHAHRYGRRGAKPVWKPFWMN